MTELLFVFPVPRVVHRLLLFALDKELESEKPLPFSRSAFQRKLDNSVTVSTFRGAFRTVLRSGDKPMLGQFCGRMLSNFFPRMDAMKISPSSLPWIR